MAELAIKCSKLEQKCLTLQAQDSSGTYIFTFRGNFDKNQFKTKIKQTIIKMFAHLFMMFELHFLESERILKLLEDQLNFVEILMGKNKDLDEKCSILEAENCSNLGSAH